MNRFGKQYRKSNNERTFSKKMGNVAAESGYSHLNHAYRENFGFRDRQFMTHAINNRWLYGHEDSWRQRRFSSDSDRNTYPYMYERNNFIDRRYETNSLRPTDFDTAYGNILDEKGGMDLDTTRRALIFTAEAKEQSEMRRLMKPMDGLRDGKREGPVGEAVGNAYEAFSDKPGRKLREGSYDTSFSETKTSAYELKAGLSKDGDDREIVSDGRALAGRAGKWEYIPEEEKEFDFDEESGEKDEEKEEKRDESPGVSLFKTIFSMSPMNGQETEEDIYKEKRREKEEDERRVKMLVAGREKLAAYTLMKGSINLGMDAHNRIRINSYHDVMGSQREEYHSGLDPRGEFKGYDKRKLESLTRGAKNVSRQFLTGDSARISQETEEGSGLGAGLFEAVSNLIGSLFTDYHGLSDDELSAMARDGEMLGRPAVRERIKKSRYAMNEYAKYVPDNKKHLISGIKDENEIKKRAVAEYCKAKKTGKEAFGPFMGLGFLEELFGQEGAPGDTPEDGTGEIDI